jgi:hypothetical protein
MQSTLSYTVSKDGLFYARIGGFTSTRASPMFERDLLKRFPESEGFRISRDEVTVSGHSTTLAPEG